MISGATNTGRVEGMRSVTAGTEGRVKRVERSRAGDARTRRGVQAVTDESSSSKAGGHGAVRGRTTLDFPRFE